MNGMENSLRLLTRLKNRRLHLGVTGSVACYKTAELLRLLLSCGIHVSATLTPSARRFISPLLFESLGAFPVYTDMFADRDATFGHLEPGQNADALFVVPATANTLAAMAAGLAGEMLHAQILAFSGPVLAAPAMNPRMWMNAATQANCTALASRGVTLVTPDSGSMACGDTGQGRLAPVPVLLLYALQALAPQDMIGQKVLVTLGPTREPWDGVRFWSNPSSGTMGACLAFAAWMRGAEVTAVTGSSVSRDLLPKGIPNLSRVDCGTAAEMYDAAAAAWPDCSMGFFSAAVADFSPVPYGSHKFKKADAQNGFSVEFAPNRDILATLAAARRPGQKVLGFAAETASSMEELLGLAREKRQRKGCDVIAANIVGRKGSGFASETNSMAVAGPGEAGEIWEARSKADVAWDLCSCLLNA